MPSSARYTALSTTESDVLGMDDLGVHLLSTSNDPRAHVLAEAATPRDPAGVPPSVRYAIWIAIACTALNVLSSVFQHYTVQPAARTFSEPEYANAYIGLEDVYRDPDSPPPPPTVNFPTVFALVNSSDPRRAYVDEHRVASGFGTYYPEDRRILVSTQVSTIVQFFAGDFGMEHCNLEFRIPPADAELVSLVHPTAIRVWALETSRLLDPSQVTWQNRPRRKDLLGVWELVHSHTFVSLSFECPMGSFQTFELSCAPAVACEVDFRQRVWTKTLGVWLIQHSTLMGRS